MIVFCFMYVETSISFHLINHNPRFAFGPLLVVSCVCTDWSLWSSVWITGSTTCGASTVMEVHKPSVPGVD